MIGKIRRNHRRAKPSTTTNLRRLNHAIVETLENRQMLSMTIDVRAADGSKAIAVSTVGQVVNLGVFAVIQGSGTAAQEGAQDITGSFIGTNVGADPVAGDLATQNIAPFDAQGTALGTQQDLNGDGNLDVGGPNPNIDEGFFFARANSFQLGSPEIEIATLTYTVTALHSGAEVDVNYRPRIATTQGAPVFAAVWMEDGMNPVNNLDGTLLVGSPVKITDVAAEPAGPLTTPDSSSAVTGVAHVINVLANDSDFTGTLNPASVTISTVPDQGGSAVVDQTTGNITYTSTPHFFGTETFSYTVKDNNGAMSAPTLVTLTVNPTLPVASDDSAITFVNNPVIVPVLSNDTSSIGFVISSLAFNTNPSNGTALINADGTITYTPKAGFVGADSFSYTIADRSGHVTNIATVSMSVGVEISSVKSGNKVVVFSDHDGTTATTTLSRGVADLTFSGAGSATVAHGKVVITAVNLVMNGITLSDTTAASTLTIRGAGGDGVISIGRITDPGVLGKIISPIANLTGTLNVAGVGTLQFASAAGATIQIGAGGPANLTIHCGALTNSTITATSASCNVITGSFTNSTLTALAVKSLKIVGNASGGTLQFSGAAGSVNIVGALSNSTLSVGAPARGTVALGNLKVTGAISGTTVSAAGDISTVVAGALSSDSMIRAGVAPSVTLANANAANLGTNKIGSVRLTNKTGNTFSNSTILAHAITSTVLGTIPINNNGVPEGVSAVAVLNVAFVALSPAGVTVQHLGKKQLVAPGVAFSDLFINIAG